MSKFTNLVLKSRSHTIPILNVLRTLWEEFLCIFYVTVVFLPTLTAKNFRTESDIFITETINSYILVCILFTILVFILLTNIYWVFTISGLKGLKCIVLFNPQKENSRFTCEESKRLHDLSDVTKPKNDQPNCDLIPR